MFDLATWAHRHGVSPAAVRELQLGLLSEMPAPPAPEFAGKSEAHVQSLVRLEGAQKGVRLWRNNVGALKDERNIPVRYGLANDSKALNDRLKSGDLIGWRPVVILPHHVGRTLAQFVSRECKHSDWTYRGDDREEAQSRWAQLVNSEGGDAAFTTGPGTL